MYKLLTLPLIIALISLVLVSSGNASRLVLASVFLAALLYMYLLFMKGEKRAKLASNLTFSAGLVAVVYNPIYPMQFAAWLWSGVSMLTAVLFAYSTWYLVRAENNKQAQKASIAKEKVVIDAKLFKNSEGEMVTNVPASLLDSTLFANKELRVNPVKELAYDYNSDAFTKVMDEFKVNPQYRIKLQKLIELNSGYLTTDLIEDEFGINNEVSTKLLSKLVVHRQAAKALGTRKLYRLQ